MNALRSLFCRRPVGTLTALAALVRIGAVIPTLRSTVFADGQEYVTRAEYLLRTHTLFPDAFRTPLYPLFIAGVLKAGGSLALVRILQALIGASMVPVTYRIARSGVSERAAVIAAAIVAFYPAWIIYAGYIMSENLFAPLLLLGFAFWSTGTKGSASAAGVAFGLASLTRAVGVAAVAGVAVASLLPPFASDRFRGRGVRLLILIAAFAITLAPWTIRNARMYHKLIPLDTNAGYNFLVGNTPTATGRLEENDWQRIKARNWQAGQSDLEFSETSIREGWQYMRANPGLTIARLPLKAAHLSEPDWREHAWVYSKGYLGRLPPSLFWIVTVLLWAAFPALLLVTILGLARSGERPGMFWPIAITLCLVVIGHMITFGESRFHLPWVSLLAVLAAKAFDSSAPDRHRSIWPRRLGVAILCIVLVAMWSWQLRTMYGQARVLARARTLPIPWIY